MGSIIPSRPDRLPTRLRKTHGSEYLAFSCKCVGISIQQMAVHTGRDIIPNDGTWHGLCVPTFQGIGESQLHTHDEISTPTSKTDIFFFVNRSLRALRHRFEERRPSSNRFIYRWKGFERSRCLVEVDFRKGRNLVVHVEHVKTPRSPVTRPSGTDFSNVLPSAN